MIWFRRFFTIPLILIFIVLLLVTVLVTAVNNTVANPNFYNDQMKQADVYDYIYTDIVPAALGEVETNQSSDLQINISDFTTELTAAAEQVLPPSWLQTQFEAVTTTLIPYVVDDKDGFTYTLVLNDRVEEAGTAIKEQILHSSAFPTLYDDLMPYVAEKVYEKLGSIASEAGVTKQQVEDTLRSSVTQDWLIIQIENVIDAVVPYMTSETNSFSINIPVQEVLNDSVILEILGPGNAQYLDVAKSLIGEGLTFTDQDLRDKIGADAQTTFDDVRGWTTNGYTVTQDDLGSMLSDDPDTLNNFDDIRHWISVGRTYLWVAWVIPFLILIAIGFLGGRGWKTRAAGPLVILFVVSLVIMLAAMMGWSQYGKHEMTDVLQQNTADSQGVEAVLLGKADEVAVNAAGGLVHSVQSMAMYMMIVSGVGLVGVSVWSVLSSRNKKDEASSPSKTRGKNGARCPICGSKTTIRTGSNTGRRSYVCSHYPECRGRIPIKSLEQSIPSDSKGDWQDW